MTKGRFNAPAHGIEAFEFVGVEIKIWYQAAQRYEDFLRRHEGMRVVFLELGVGANTPVIIKYPFWKMTAANHDATYVCSNFGEATCPKGIKERSICIDGDIGPILNNLLQI